MWLQTPRFLHCTFIMLTFILPRRVFKFQGMVVEKQNFIRTEKIKIMKLTEFCGK
jgi:hypothetical protein